MGKSKQKEITAVIKLQIPAGKANPAPPVGSMLGPKGVNIKAFCDEFNEATKNLNPGDPVPVEISVFADRSFKLLLKTPPASFLIRKVAGLDKGSKTPGREVIATVKRSALRDVAKIKMEGMGVDSLEAALNSLCGTAASMGIKIEEE